jgi:NADPH-dependent 2,4-dienoyl-CoA reductase/sulfur reductase-like enzyme
VIVGAGIGGVRVAEQLRSLGYADPITLVGAEPEPPYDRPPLSKQVLRGERDLVLLREPASYDELGVALRLGVAATGVDTAARTVALDDGTTVRYDALVVATGARPRELPGAPRPAGVHVLRTAEDCRRLRDDVGRASRAVVVGGGFIGCEVAASLRGLGLEVTIVEMASAPLVTVLGERVVPRVVQMHEENGVALRCGVGVESLVGDDRVRAVRLADGSELLADVVVVGLGVSPAVDWLDGSGVSVATGVVCDERGRTSAADVFAIGDVAAWRDPRTGAHRRVEHWTTATDHAAVVAAQIVGGPEADPGRLPVPYFWSDQYRVKIQSLGVPTPDADVEVVDITDRKRVALYGVDGVLTGVVGFSAPSAVMKTRAMLESATSLDDAVARVKELAS